MTYEMSISYSSLLYMLSAVLFFRNFHVCDIVVNRCVADEVVVDELDFENVRLVLLEGTKIVFFFGHEVSFTITVFSTFYGGLRS